MSAPAGANGSLVGRSIRALKFDQQVYSEIAQDPAGTTQAMTVVVLTAVAPFIGNLVVDGVGTAVGSFVAAILSFFILVGLVYVVGTKMIPAAETSATATDAVRGLGLAQAPAVVTILLAIAGLGPLPLLVGGLWAMVTSIIAVKAIFTMSTGRAVATGFIASLIGFAASAAVVTAIFS